MYLRRIILFSILGILLFIFFTQEYRPGREERIKESLYPKVQQILREQKERDTRLKGDNTIKDERIRRKLLAQAAVCDKQYTRCLERCENSACEDRCMKTLQRCEKDLPDDLKTVK